MPSPAELLARAHFKVQVCRAADNAAHPWAPAGFSLSCCAVSRQKGLPPPPPPHPRAARPHMLATTLGRPTAWWHGGKNIAAFELLATWCQDCWCSASSGWFYEEPLLDSHRTPALHMGGPNLNAPESSAWGRTRMINWFCCYFSSLYFPTSFRRAKGSRVHMLSIL